MVDKRILSTESVQLVSTISAESTGWGIIPATVVYSVCCTAARLGWSGAGMLLVEMMVLVRPTAQTNMLSIVFKRNVCKLPGQGLLSESSIYHHLFFLLFIFQLGSGSLTHKYSQTFNEITIYAEAHSRAKLPCEYYIYSHFNGANSSVTIST